MKDYCYIISCLYDLNPGQSQGYTENELSLAEQKLDCKLPASLRQYYLLLGKNNALNNTFNRLLAPNELYYTPDNHLIFYEENQEVVIWGLNAKTMGDPDPAVWGSYDTGRAEWFVDSDTTEHFLLSMAYLSGVLGGLSYRAMKVKPSSETISFIEKTWKEQKDITNQYLRFFTNDYSGILVLMTNEAEQAERLYIASNHKEAYLAMSSRLNLLWNECTNCN